MKQIRTIHDRDSIMFDEEVNDALADGWKLKRRYNDEALGHCADLEREDHSCDDCRHHDKLLIDEPCNQCNERYEKREEKV